MKNYSFVDSAPVQTKNGDIVTLSTLYPAGGGIQGGLRNPTANPFKEVDGVRYVILTTNEYVSANTVIPLVDFEFMAPAAGGPIVQIDGSTLPADLAGHSIDKHWDIFKDGTPVLVDQLDTNVPKKVEANIAFRQANFRNISISYIAMNRSTDNGKTWGKPMDISYMFRPLTDYQHYIVSPGKGIRSY